MTHLAIRFVYPAFCSSACLRTLGLPRPSDSDYEQTVTPSAIWGILAGLSLALLLWQWLAARRFPLHERNAELLIGSKLKDRNAPHRSSALPPAVTLLKPVIGCDTHTENCLRSWLAQDYTGEIQTLFGVASLDDPVCAIVSQLMTEFPARDARVIVCGSLRGANAKVAKIAALEKLAKHDLLVISDADVRVPADFVANVLVPLRDPEVGLVNCFYRLANPSTLAMRWEAVAVNADFWSQVLQAQTLGPLDFALGAAMATRRRQLAEIGGFASLADCLADDFQLGNRIARRGHRIALCPVIVECWDPPMTWGKVWKHQLRWARTIRVSRPGPYLFSILGNPTLWPLLWLLLAPAKGSLALFITALGLRMLTALDLQWRLTRSLEHVPFLWLAPIKDLLQTALWFCAFAGNSIEWRGEKFVLQRDGNLRKV
jgi:ceramide glucosyltransferase